MRLIGKQRPRGMEPLAFLKAEEGAFALRQTNQGRFLSACVQPLKQLAAPLQPRGQRFIHV